MAITIPGFTPSSPFTDAFLQYVRDEQEARRQREIEKANEPGMGGLIGQIAGTAIGFVTGGPPGAVIGGSIGSGIGGAVDPRATSTQRLQSGAQAATSLFSAAFSAQDITGINRQEAQDRFGPGTSLDQLISGADRFQASGGGDFTSEFARQILGTGDDPRQRRSESRRTRDRREEETFRQQGRFELEDFRSANRGREAALRGRLAIRREARSELSAAFNGTGYATVDEGLTAFQQLQEQDPNASFSDFLGRAKLDESSRIAAAGLDITLTKDRAREQQKAEQQQAAEEDQKILAITEDASAFVITPEQVEKFGVLSRNIESVRENRIDLDRSYLPVLRKAKQDLRDFVRPFQKRKPPPTLEQLLKTPGGMSQYTDDGFILNQTKDGITVTRPPVGFMGNSEDGFQTFTVRDEDTGAITGVVVTGPDRKTHSFPVQPDPERAAKLKFAREFVKDFARGGDITVEAAMAASIQALKIYDELERVIKEQEQGIVRPEAQPDPAAQDPVTVEQIAALMESQALPSQWPAGALAQGQEMIETQARQIMGTRNENGVFPDEATKDQFRYLARLLREIDIRKQGAER